MLNLERVMLTLHGGSQLGNPRTLKFCYLTKNDFSVFHSTTDSSFMRFCFVLFVSKAALLYPLQKSSSASNSDKDLSSLCRFKRTYHLAASYSRASTNVMCTHVDFLLLTPIWLPFGLFL